MCAREMQHVKISAFKMLVKTGHVHRLIIRVMLGEESLCQSPQPPLAAEVSGSNKVLISIPVRRNTKRGRLQFVIARRPHRQDRLDRRRQVADKLDKRMAHPAERFGKTDAVVQNPHAHFASMTDRHFVCPARDNAKKNTSRRSGQRMACQYARFSANRGKGAQSRNDFSRVIPA